MDEAWITADELLAWAVQHGCSLTARQLERWRKDDLLPRPRRVSLGRGRGVRSEYPPHTRAHLLALSRLHVHERRLDHLCFLLWREGYPIVGSRIKAAIRHLALAPLYEVMARAEGSEDAAADLSVTMMMERDRSGLRRRVRRQQLTDAEIQRLGMMAVQLLLGGPPVFAVQSSLGSRTAFGPAELWVRGLGLEPARTETIAGAPPWLGSNAADTLAWLETQGILSYKYLDQTLADASDEQLAHARSDLERFAEGLVHFADMLNVTGAPPILGWVWKMMDLAKPALAAFVVLALLAARRTLGDAPLDELGSTLAAGRPQHAALRALLAMEPALQPYLHPNLGMERFAQLPPDEQESLRLRFNQLLDAHPEWATALGLNSGSAPPPDAPARSP